MAQLKALRSAIGSYGRVAANGIVDVDEDVAEKLIETGNFVRAQAEDIEAAKLAQKEWLRLGGQGTSNLFPHLAQRDPSSLSLHEITAITADIIGGIALNDLQASDGAIADLNVLRLKLGERVTDLDAREAALNERQNELDTVSANQTAEGQRLTALAEELGGRETALADLGTDIDAREKALQDAETKLAADREAHDKVVADAATAAKPKKSGGA